MNRLIGLAASFLIVGVSLGQTVEFRIVERATRSAVTGPLDAELNCAVQGRVVGGPAGSVLANFTFAIRIVGEPETSGVLARGLINNADHTYASAIGLSSMVGRGGIASQYSYLAALNATFNGLINTTGGNYTNLPDQDIGQITGDASGAGLLNTPGIDADGDGNPDTWSGNGTGATPPGGILLGVNPAAAATYFGAGGSWVDLYRFRYTVSEFSPRTLVFRLYLTSASIGQQLGYQGGLWGAKVSGSAQAIATDLLIPVAASTPSVCCDVITGSCAVVQPAECIGMFFPSATACTPNPCATPGVCCTPTGGCGVSIQPQCGGVWHAGISCASDPCPPMGTCCSSNWACVVEPAAFCAGYWTALATCPSAYCSPGACCNINTGACTSVTPALCTAAQTAFAGPGVSCPSSTTCPVQSCCNLVTMECTTGNFGQSCGNGFSPLAPGTACDVVPCPGMLCCNTLTGACTIVGLSAVCPASAVSSGAGTSCFPSPCPRQLCCNILSGACSIIGPQGACPAGAISYPGSTCASPPCPRQSCCNLVTGYCQTVGAAGTCPDQTVAQNTPTCSGVSCATAGCCSTTTSYCSTIGPAGSCPAGSVPQPPGATCSPGICPAMACCSITSVGCFVVGPSGTCSAGMRSIGAGTTCTPNVCPPAGRCCVASGACSVLVQAACTALWVSGTSCYPNPCPQPHPCCDAAGACTMVLGSACAGTAAIQSGTCYATLCSQVGACCQNLSCTATFASGCEGSSTRRFKGPGTTCGTASNPIACCIANFNHVDGVTFQDLFDYLNAWFAHDIATDTDHNGTLTVGDLTQFFNAWVSGC